MGLIPKKSEYPNSALWLVAVDAVARRKNIQSQQQEQQPAPPATAC